ncbi:cell division FtsA domain-containing protein [Candidatus Wolfebacteria bacterium]|nr:cell division FtsA domain-containing protein [Candidatus Wolfebacteria bacterium]
MGFFSRRKHQKVTIAVVFDIGSASVGAALTLIRPNEKPHVVYNTRRYMVFQDEFNFDRFVASMLSTLDAVAHDIEKDGLAHLTFSKGVHRRMDQILCSYASPWYLSQTRIIDMHDEKPFILSKEVVERAVHKQEEEIAREGGEHYESGMGEHIDMLEKAVTDIKLNGYTVSNPYSKRATSAQFTLTVSVIARVLRERIEDTVFRVFHARTIKHHSFALIAWSGITNYIGASRDFLSIDVSGEVTDVALAHGGALLETVSFPHGSRYVLRGLNRTLHTSSGEARTLLALRESKTVSTDIEPKLERVLTEVKTTWLTQLGEALARFDSHAQIPGNVFLTTSDWAGPLFTSFIEDEAWARYTRTHRPMQVTSINGTLLQPFVTFREGVVTDPFLALAALYQSSMMHVTLPHVVTTPERQKELSRR